jgi:energy-coupling factor transport system permease protein
MNQAMGFYAPGSGWLHRLHPVPKLLGVVWGITAPFILPTSAIPVLIAAYIAAALSAGLRERYLRGVLVAPLPILLPIVLINGFFYPGATEFLLTFGPFNLTREGLDFGLPIAGRVLAAFAVTVAFVMTTRPDDLMEALVQRGANPKLAFVVLSAIQTIPRMLDKAGRILDAQQARGLPTSGNWRVRARSIVPLLGPLVIGSLIDVRDRSLALEARAFASVTTRTAYREVPYGPTDRLATRAALAALVLLPLLLVARVAGALGG